MSVDVEAEPEISEDALGQRRQGRQVPGDLARLSDAGQGQFGVDESAQDPDPAGVASDALGLLGIQASDGLGRCRPALARSPARSAG